jgi:KDO2-lipid IV(A) lauroyltransferase
LKKKRRKKALPLALAEYWLAYIFILIAGILPMSIAKGISGLLGDLLYFISLKRRRIAMENLRHAFMNDKDEEEIKSIARKSCRSFVFTFLEMIKLRHVFSRPDAMERLRVTTDKLDILFQKAKKIHDQSGGCIFVTPHIGNWEVLPHASAKAGIPVAIVVRPLDNEYLEKLIYAKRTSSGQMIIPKRNALMVLQKTLQSGTSVGILPDQSTAKGISIDFFGRKATATPVPAMLAITYNRPIVVVAACRKNEDYRYEGFVSDPIWPGEYSSEKDEIFRITEEMTREMESIIRRYPEQYLWIHNRWKTYKDRKAVMS